MRRLALLAALALVAACGSTATAPSAAPTRLATAPVIRTAAPTTPVAGACEVKPVTFVKAPSKATITLEKGAAIVITLRPDKAPNTVTNFANVAMSGCYNGLTFHRVELSPAPFVIQGGDPLGTGTGGGSQPTELSDLPFIKGAVGIARVNDIKVSNDRQFFICIGDCLFLNNMYTNFGQVTSGQDVADNVKIGDKIKTIVIE